VAQLARKFAKKIGGAKIFDIRRITLFCLENRLSKHKMNMFFKNLGGHGPLAPPGYVYVRDHLDSQLFFSFSKKDKPVCLWLQS